MPPDLMPYVVLLMAFLDGRLSAADFATVYVTLFKHDVLMRPHEIYEVLNEVFGAADSYHEDSQPSDPIEVNEDGLRRIAIRGLERLAELVERQPDD